MQAPDALLALAEEYVAGIEPTLGAVTDLDFHLARHHDHILTA